MINTSYYIAFTHSALWHQRFCKDGFGHCFAFFPLDAESLDDCNEVILLENNPAFANCGIVSKDALMEFTSINQATIIFVESKRSDKISKLSFISGLDTCVTFIKKLLGIKKWYIITPNQLYKEINSWAK